METGSSARELLSKYQCRVYEGEGGINRHDVYEAMWNSFHTNPKEEEIREGRMHLLPEQPSHKDHVAALISGTWNMLYWKKARFHSNLWELAVI